MVCPGIRLPSGIARPFGDILFWRSRQDPSNAHNMEEANGGNVGEPQPRPEASTINAVMMPWFMGGPGMPKFSGMGGSAAFAEWQPQMEAFLRAQGLSGQQKVDFVLSALEGEAKQEVQLAESTSKDTTEKANIHRPKEGSVLSVQTGG